MSNKAATTRPFERFGWTGRDEYDSLTQLHLAMNGSEPKDRSCNENPLYDWEAAAVTRVNKAFPDDMQVRALMAALLKLVDDDVRRQHIEANSRLVPRANTAGMFFAPNVPLSEQSRCASI